MTPVYILPPCKTIDELVLAAVLFLEAHGYEVSERPREWETREMFCGRMGISTWQFKRKMRGRFRPAVQLDVGPEGRLRKLRATLEFENWMKK